MLPASLPAENLRPEHLLLDVNGTLADRGRPIEAAIEALSELRPQLVRLAIGHNPLWRR
jgi:hypothetical protein